MPDPKTEPETESSPWRRRLLVGSAVIVGGMYLRRRLSGSSDRTRTKADEQRADPSTDSSTDSASRDGRSIGRRVKMLVISTVVFAVARSVVRRFKRGR